MYLFFLMDLQREQELVKQAKESLKAFDELYEYYLPRIYGYIFNRTINKEITEDLVSETFMKALSNIQKFRFKGYTFGAWLYRIAHNNIIDYFRKHPDTRFQPLKDDQEDDDFSEELVEQEERKRLILKCLTKLSDENQQILSLKFFEEMSNDEIAGILGCKKANIAVKMHRALKSFEKIIKSERNQLLSLNL